MTMRNFRTPKQSVFAYTYCTDMFCFRLLEEGNIQEAEGEKVRVEQMQREKRKNRDEEKVTYCPKWFM